MPTLTSLSQHLVESNMAKAIEVQPIRREVSLQQIKIVDQETVEYNGHRIKMTTQAFRDFMNILKIPTNFAERFKGIVGQEAQEKFINTIKNVMAQSGNKTVTLVLNQASMMVVAVHKTNRNLISNASALSVVDRIINEAGLDVADFSINTDNGGFAVNAFSTRNQFNIPGMKDEDFIGGISFTNNPTNGFQVSPYINRLVCANGMVTRGFEEQFKLTKLDEDEMRRFMENLAHLRNNHYQPFGFTDAVRLCANTPASLYEMRSAANALRGVTNIDYEMLENWIPVKSTEKAFARHGVDAQILNNAQMKNAKTGVSVWDLINGVTHFATHDNGFELNDYDRRRLQVVAGQMLTATPDMSNMVSSPF